MRVRLSQKATSASKATTGNSKGVPSGPLGVSGLLPGELCGANIERVVGRVATHVAGVFSVGELPVQLTGEPSAVVPFMNWTVPVMAGPLLTPELTEAVKLMLPPVEIEVALGVRVVVVLAPLMVMETAEEVEAA